MGNAPALIGRLDPGFLLGALLGHLFAALRAGLRGGRHGQAERRRLLRPLEEPQRLRHVGNRATESEVRNCGSTARASDVRLRRFHAHVRERVKWTAANGSSGLSRAIDVRRARTCAVPGVPGFFSTDSGKRAPPSPPRGVPEIGIEPSIDRLFRPDTRGQTGNKISVKTAPPTLFSFHTGLRVA